MFSQSLMISFAMFGLVMAVVYLVLSLTYRSQVTIDERIAELAAESGGNRARKNRDATRASELAVAQRRAKNRTALNNEADQRRYQARLIQAGIYDPNALSIFVTVKLLLMVTPLAVGVLAGIYRVCPLYQGLMIGGILSFCGLLFPEMWLKGQIKVRHVLLRRSLPDFLDLLIICVEGGLSVQAAIQRVSDELKVAHPVLSGEFSVVQRDTELGSSVDVALRRFADRSGYEGLRTLSTCVREAQRFGTELAQALRDHAEMLRNQRELAAEETAQKASVKVLFPMLLFILPAVFVVLVGPAAFQIYEAFSK